MTDQLRGVFLGAGHFAKIQLDAWKAISQVKIVGIYNRTKDKAQELAQMYDIEMVEDDVRTLLEKACPDFVDICTAVETHLPFAKIAADMGIPVLCQKPVAPTWEEMMELVNYCREKRVRLMINENWRWQSWYREIKSLLDRGVLGEPIHTYCAMRPGDGWGPEPYALQPFFRNMEQFLLFETGVHYLDTLRFLFGEVYSVYCLTRRVNPAIKGEDLAIVHLNFANGMTAIYDGNRVAYTPEVRTPVNGFMIIEGSNANLRLSSHGEIFITPRGGREYRHDYEIVEGYRGGGAMQTQRHFAECLITGAPFESDGDAYLHTVRCVYACYKSAVNQTVERM
ncbi:MAG: hypothetical protein K0S39_4574 [Paenibacillus sp.]|nr:hypothetical protein [Paenibacillus sp.]